MCNPNISYGAEKGNWTHDLTSKLRTVYLAHKVVLLVNTIEIEIDP